MICPKCGTENKPKFKFCVKCGSNLEDPNEVNIEQVDMGGYRSEDDGKDSFKIGSGTFTIRDSAPVSNSGMFTADELNDTDEEFDFSNIDEPFIPKLDADRIKVPVNNAQPQNGMGMNPQMQGQPMNGMGMNPQMQGQPMNGMGMNPQMQGQPMNGMGMNPQMQGQPMNGMGMNPQMQGQPMNGMGMNPQMQGQPMNGMGMNPQMQGQPMNGMGMNPQMYGQPAMAPPPIIGYDQSGMPIYGQAQPMMYGQPVIVGYDQNGMPIYGQAQPMMYGQPMMNDGGDHNPVMNAPGMPVQGMGMPMQNGMYGMPVQQPVQPKAETDQVKVPNKFWNEFFSDDDDGEGADTQEDFFGKPSHGASKGMGSVSAEGMDFGKLKKTEHKKRDYMGSTPDVDASELKPNENDKFNKMYMRKADFVKGADLGEKRQTAKRPVMNVTAEVNAESLEAYERKKNGITMNQAGIANADDLKAYEHEHKESIMAQADHAVEAMPKKKEAIVDEIDAIELPEYMQARKTVHTEETPEIPDLPEV